MSGLSVATRNVNAEIVVDGIPKTLLYNVNFLARPGEMTAIMGPSGCGKTTFLNVLSNRQSKAYSVSGEVLYAGHADLLSKVNNFSAYVMQEDFFLQRLTVRETIVFAARLRLADKTYDEQLALADKIMSRLGLELCADVLIGGTELKGISGGQRKRVSIAVALLDDPKIIYLDEPTSGLDAALAYDVVATLQLLAKKFGKTVIATIHQPRAEVFAMFDNLLLMRLGKVIYHGPCANAVEFSASIGHPCPDDYNPSDFYLDLLTESASPQAGKRVLPSRDDSQTFGSDSLDQKLQALRAGSIELPTRIQVRSDVADSFAEAFANTEGAAQILADIEQLKKTASEADLADLQRSRHTRGSFVTNVNRFARSVYILTLRGLREGSRRPEFIYVNFLQTAVLGVVVSTLFYKIPKPQVPSDICDIPVGRNALGGMIQVVSNTAFSSFDSAVLQINRRPLINREASGGLYTRVAATIANWLADGAFHYLAAMVYSLIFYWIMDLRHQFSSYMIWMLLLWSTKFTFWGASSAIGALAPNIAGGMGMVPLSNVLLFMVSGYQKTDAQIPRGLAWLKKISPIRYAWQGIVRSQLDPSNTGYLERCFGFSTPSSWVQCWLLVMLIAVVTRILGLLCSHFLHKNQGVQA